MNALQKTILIAVAAALVGFALGALWQYTSVRSQAQQMERLERELELQTLEATLGAATIEAQRGSYEISRQLASDFFGGLERELRLASGERRRALDEISQQRDAMITVLSRSDPQAGSMLAQLFTRYRIAMGKPVGTNAGTVPSPAAETPP
jgi:hypothetical protein